MYNIIFTICKFYCIKHCTNKFAKRVGKDYAQPTYYKYSNSIETWENIKTIEKEKEGEGESERERENIL